jgi:hypothetical protein
VLTEDAILARAYELWEQSGKPDGQSEEFWRRAKAELEDAEETPDSDVVV